MSARRRAGHAEFEKVSLVYDFFHDRALTGESFTLQEILDLTGWEPQSFQTYKSKQWKEVLVKRGKNKYEVHPSFSYISKKKFLDHFSQTRTFFAEYEREKYEEVMVYEFLLPLTREEHLRTALDSLFYSDTIERRVKDTGLIAIGGVIRRRASESDGEYIERICRTVSERFVGYSITHVHGRFRAGNIRSREEAGKLLSKDRKYLIDETTAVVRFIIPCQSSCVTFRDDCESIFRAVNSIDKAEVALVRAEVSEIRALFFLFFVEAILKIVAGEDEIWLLEMGKRHRLFKLKTKEPN